MSSGSSLVCVCVCVRTCGWDLYLGQKTMKKKSQPAVASDCVLVLFSLRRNLLSSALLLNQRKVYRGLGFVRRLTSITHTHTHTYFLSSC